MTSGAWLYFFAQLTTDEYENLRFQFETLEKGES